MTIKPPQRYGARIILLSFIVLVTMVLFASTAIGAPDYIAGDVNGDGKIDVRDVVLVQKEILGLNYPPLTAVQLLAADVNGDGDIDISDAVTIMKIALGIVDSYPMPIVSLNDAVVRVPIKTALADINLPSTVEANFAGGIKRNISVRWERVSTPAYNPFVFDEYVFRGDLVNLPSGVRNPAGLRATAKVSFLLRDPWPFPGPRPDNTFRLSLDVSPAGAGTTFGQGFYFQGERIFVEVDPAPGYRFLHWRRGPDILPLATQFFTYTMPGTDTTLTAVLTDDAAWDPRILGEPEIFDSGGIGFIWTVSVYIRPEYVGQVTGVTILGQPALNDSSDPSRWHRAFSQPVTPGQLIGQITVLPPLVPGTLQIIDVANSRALFEPVFPGGITEVWVAIRAGQVAQNVTANGLPLLYDSSLNVFYGSLTGLSPGDTVTVRAYHPLGLVVDTKVLTVLAAP